jgi:hypothetical protein
VRRTELAHDHRQRRPVHTASLCVRSDTPGATLKLKLREYWKDNGAFVAEAKSAGALTNTWQQVTGTFEPAPTAAC